MPLTTRSDPPEAMTTTLYRVMNSLYEHLSRSATPNDGVLSVRVIGEFSAGKTRLLRELLGRQIPPALFPISSLERQTRLPLEITYGDPATLELIERANDYDSAAVVTHLNTFPERDQLVQYDPQHHRLRLTIPELRLFLPNGDHYNADDQTSKRLLLIDMPGWGSGDDAIAEGDAGAMMAGDYNLALVFVVNASRLDGENNAARLRDFLEVLAGADFVADPTLLIVITHCPCADQERLTVRLRRHVTALWQEELEEESEALQLHLLAVDFAELTPDELSAFSATFWRHLLAPLQQEPTAPVTPPWIAAMRRWSAADDPRPRLRESSAWLAQIRNILAQVAPTAGDFLPGMNRHRLLGLEADAIHARLLQQWWRKTGYPNQQQLAASLAPPAPLFADHPLGHWWSDYWQANLEQTWRPVWHFFEAAEQALRQVQPDTPDINAHLARHLNESYYAATQALDSSFTVLMESVEALAEESQLERVVATLLSLSLLEARYAEQYAKQRGI